MKKRLFTWIYSEAVRRNRGDIHIPLAVMDELPDTFTIDFDGIICDGARVDARGRIRGKGIRRALVQWIDTQELQHGQKIEVYFDQDKRLLIFRS